VLAPDGIQGDFGKAVKLLPGRAARGPHPA
jgi:hypothetical protein